MVDLLSAAIFLWLFLALVFALVGLFIWAFPFTSDDKRNGSRIFFVSLVWPVAFVVWLVMNFRRLLADAGREAL